MLHYAVILNVYLVFIINCDVNKLFFLYFFSLRKKLPMMSLAMCVCPSVCPSSAEISLERGSNRSAEPIDLKIGRNM